MWALLPPGGVRDAWAQSVDKTADKTSVETHPTGSVEAAADLPQAGRRWVEIIPSAYGAEPQLLLVDPAATEVSLPRVEAGTALVCVGGDGLATTCRFLDLSSPPVMAVDRELGVQVRGCLLLSREPLAGARLAVAPVGLALRRAFLLPLELEKDGRALVRHIESHRDGTFVLPALAPGEYRLEVERPDGRTELLSPFTVPWRRTLLPPRASTPSPAEATSREASPATESKPSVAVLELPDFVLDPGLTVSFLLTAASGEPLAGARILVSQDAPTPDEAPLSLEGRAGRDGRLVLAGVAADRPLAATCTAPGFASQRQRFDSPPVEVLCRLDPLASLGGRVLVDGEPMGEVTLALTPPPPIPGAQPRPLLSAPDGEGRFRYRDLSPGRYRLSAAVPGYRVERRDFDLAGGEQGDLGIIELEPAAAVHGIVVDRATGEPVADARLGSIEPPGAVAAETDADGRFTVTADSEQPIQLLVTASGYPPTVVPFHPASVRDEEMRIELEAGGYLEVTVWDEESGTPCLGCDVSYYRTDSSWEVDRGELRTGNQGSARSALLPAGEYEVSLSQVASQGSSLSIRWGDHLRRARIEPHQTTRVTFGEPHPTIEIRLWPPPPPEFLLRTETGTAVHAYDPVAPGQFVVRKRPGQTLVLRLIGPGASVRLSSLPADSKLTRVDLELPRTLVMGRVMAAEGEGRVVALRAVDLSTGEPAGWTRSNPDGTFSLRFLPPGGYLLEVENVGLLTFALSPSDDLDLGDLSLPGPP